MSRPHLDRPVFVVGAPRSGTTLLRSLLTAHSRLTITPETHFLTKAGKFGELHAPIPDLEEFWNQYIASTRFQDLGIDPEVCRQRIDAYPNPTFRDVFRTLLETYAADQGKPRVGEKTPKHIYHIGDLLEWFPDCRIIAVLRDPRAVIASQLRSPWIQRHIEPASVRGGVLVRSRLARLISLAEEWSDIYHRELPRWQGQENLQTVSYETLVRKPEQELRRICEFVGEAFEESMITGRSEESVHLAYGTERLKDDEWRQWRIQHHTQSLKAISPESLNKWKRSLSPWETCVIESVCAEGMRAAGLDLSRPAPVRFAVKALTRILLELEHCEAWSRALLRKVLLPSRKSSGSIA